MKVVPIWLRLPFFLSGYLSSSRFIHQRRCFLQWYKCQLKKRFHFLNGSFAKGTHSGNSVGTFEDKCRFFYLVPDGEENLDLYRSSYKFCNKLVHFPNWHLQICHWLCLNLSTPYILYLMCIHMVAPILSFFDITFSSTFHHTQYRCVINWWILSHSVLYKITHSIETKLVFVLWQTLDHHPINFVISIDQ